jgi:hypothetical protein
MIISEGKVPTLVSGGGEPSESCRQFHLVSEDKDAFVGPALFHKLAKGFSDRVEHGVAAQEIVVHDLER